MTDDVRPEIYAISELFEADLLKGRYDPARAPVIPVRSFALDQPIEAAAGPDASYALLSACLASATRSLDIYIYNLTGQHIADLIHARLAAGVAVRILYDVNDMKGGEAGRIDALRAAGAKVRKAPSTGPSSVFTVCHQKICIANGRRTCLGSGNWGGSAFPETVPRSYTRSNREWVATLDDAGLGAWWSELFQADWDVADAALPQDFGIEVETLDAPLFRPVGGGKPPGPFPAYRGAAAGAKATPIPSPDAYLRKVAPLLDGAQKRILVQQQYILPQPSVLDLLARIRKRRDAGAEVRVIVSPQFRKVGDTDNWELSQQALAAHGLEDCLRAMNIDIFSHLHNKGLVVDDKVIVSSTNWSENSLTRAREAGVILEEAALADYFAAIFDADWALAWPSGDVKPNMAGLMLEAAITPGGMDRLSHADIL